MNPLFSSFERYFDELKEILQDDLPRTLRLFNIRFRLALDINIDFNGELSLTKSPEVKSTYIKLIKLLEKWNAFEALTHYANSLTGYTKQREPLYKAYLKYTNDESGCSTILSVYSDEIKFEYITLDTFKTSMNEYFKRIEEDENIKLGLKENCRNFFSYLKGERAIVTNEILGLIYAERNMYYHNGETAKMGMAYSHRKKLIDIYSNTIEDYILQLSIYILRNEKVKNV